MIPNFLKRRPAPEAAAAETIHAALVTKARDPAFYRDLGAPDTLPGRFEMVVVHAALYFRRLKGEGPAAQATAQAVFDTMTAGLDAALREIGVGDLTVPKRMKAMASSFYDGAATYDAALDSGDRAALAEALGRIVYRGAPPEADHPARLADYVFRAADALAAQPVAALTSAGPAFPDVVAAR